MDVEMKANMPFRPILPPKKGYVEVADENGNHIYKATEETLEEQKKDERIAELESENETLKEQVTNLEDCILEIADVVYA